MELALNLLISTHDQDVNVVKEAENMLKTMESEPGFFTFLLKVILDQTQSFNARFSAAIYLKNAIKRCWNRIHFEEKNDIKRKLLFFYELEPQIDNQMLFVVVEIANNEFPDTWMELLPFLLSAILSHDKRHKYKAYSVLFEIVRHFRKKYKANRGIVIKGDAEWIATGEEFKKIIEEITSKSFVAIYQSWTQLNTQYLLVLKSNISESGELEQTALLALKILYKIVCFGDDFSPEMLTFISDVKEILKPYVEICMSLGKSSEILRKYITFLTKTLRKVLEKNKPSCVPFVPDILQNCVAFCFTKEFQDLPERLLCFFMRLMCAVLKYGKTEGRRFGRVNEFRDYDKQKADMLSSILNESAVKEVCNQLVYKYLLLTKSDLQLWETDPEEYASQEFGEFAKYNCHEAASSLLSVILWECGYEVKEEIIKEFNRLLFVPASDVSGIIVKDAAYQALGSTTFHIYDEVAFENLHLTLLSELQTCHLILKRRIIWFFMKWNQFKRLKDYAVHEAVLHLMNHNENLVVRLEGANFFKEQSEHTFEETVSPAWERVYESLFKMLEDINPCDLKMFILDVISTLIRIMGKKMSVFSHSVLRLLLEAWNNSGHHMVKNAIMMNCTKLFEAGMEWDENLLQPIFSWIALSTDESQPFYDSFFENALDLWVAVVKTTEEKDSNLLELAKNLLTLKFNNQHFCTILKIMKCYLLLYKEIFIQKFGMSLVQTLTSLKADFNDDDWEHVLKFIGTVFTMYPKYGPHLFKPFLSGLLGTSIIKYDNYARVKSWQAYLISRILFCNELCFRNLLEIEAQAKQTNVDVCLNELIHFFNDCIMGKRSTYFCSSDFKIVALGLTSLLTMDFNAVRNNIQNIISLVIILWRGITDDECVFIDNVIPESSSDDKYCINHSEKLKNALKRRDVVCTTSLGELFSFQISKLTKIIGMENFLQSISTCDEEDIRLIQNLLNMVN